MAQTKEKRAEYNKAYYQKNKEQILEYQKEYNQENKEQIKEQKAEYNKEYNKENKEQIAEYKKEYYKENKEQIKEYKKEYDKENKEQKKEYNKEYYQENKEQIAEYNKENKEQTLEYQKEYRKENKEQIKEQKKEYQKERARTDAVFKLKGNIRTLIRHSFINKGYSKKSKTCEILGCSFEFFKNHLEDSAIRNYGFYDPDFIYHIDHIIPLATAKTEEEVIKINHYSNLQYLTPEDNLKKSDKIDWTLSCSISKGETND